MYRDGRPPPALGAAPSSRVPFEEGPTVRRPRALTAVLALAAGLLAGTPPALAAPAPRAALAADTCTWHNARIDGGGFVPGIVFNRSEKNLIHARTDIGGGYRWQEATRTWTPLLDSVGWNEWGSSVAFGFTGSWSGANAGPASFRLGDQTCAAA
ncbi:hypothetical protein GCM10009787_40150 [Streptomyces bangladeshensis]|uniref:Uncharacterized protein n=1 Tax=Streptomyces bangladeshensis TaxID=295352 RepID=A0ABN3BN32_9ACTN